MAKKKKKKFPENLASRHLVLPRLPRIVLSDRGLGTRRQDMVHRSHHVDASLPSYRFLRSHGSPGADDSSFGVPRMGHSSHPSRRHLLHFHRSFCGVRTENAAWRMAHVAEWGTGRIRGSTGWSGKERGRARREQVWDARRRRSCAAVSFI